MNFHIMTLFPEMVMEGMSESITGQSFKTEYYIIKAVNIRDFCTQENIIRLMITHMVAARGMLMQAEPVYQAVSSMW